jgi:hypothetical protein
VNDTDKVVITMSRVDTLIADTAVAVLKPTWLSVNTGIDVDFGEFPTRFSGQLNIPAAALRLATLSSIGFPMDLYLRVGARRPGTGDSVFLAIPASERRLLPGSDIVRFDSSEVGQFLSQFSTELPESLRIMGQVLANPHDMYNPTLAGVGSVGRNSSLSGMVDLEVPLMLGISNGMYADTVSLGDTTGDGYVDYSINRERINELNSGRLFFDVVNGIPLQVTVTVRLLNSSRQTILVLPQSGQGIQVGAAGVDGQGNVNTAVRSTSSVELNRQEVHEFIPAAFLAYSVSLNTTPGSPAVRFRTTDFVRLRVWSNLSYRVNG